MQSPQGASLPQVSGAVSSGASLAQVSGAVSPGASLPQVSGAESSGAPLPQVPGAESSGASLPQVSGASLPQVPGAKSSGASLPQVSGAVASGASLPQVSGAASSGASLPQSSGAVASGASLPQVSGAASSGASLPQSSGAVASGASLPQPPNAMSSDAAVSPTVGVPAAEPLTDPFELNLPDLFGGEEPLQASDSPVDPGPLIDEPDVVASPVAVSPQEEQASSESNVKWDQQWRDQPLVSVPMVEIPFFVALRGDGFASPVSLSLVCILIEEESLLTAPCAFSVCNIALSGPPLQGTMPWTFVRTVAVKTWFVA